MNPNLTGRAIVLILSFIIGGWLAFKETPELDGVRNATFYRLCYMLVCMRGVGFIAFDLLGLFPLN